MMIDSLFCVVILIPKTKLNHQLKNKGKPNNEIRFIYSRAPKV